MNVSLEARNLINQGRLREATILLDKALAATPDNDDLWYLRGAVSLKLNNHDYAQECLEKAIAIAPKALYHKTMGMAHLEMFQVEHAVDALDKALVKEPKDVEGNFLMAISLVLLDDPRAKQFMEKAYLLNKKKTKEMLGDFVHHFFIRDPTVAEGIKKELLKKIESIK
jgi:tetratricopeptide (TPR) repeat protein